MLRRMATFLIALMMFTAVSMAEVVVESEPIVFVASQDLRPSLASDKLLEIHFFSVGAADAILLRMGEKTMLVDSGNRRTADRVVGILRELNINKLDYAFATHPHNDHIGGFFGILEQMPVDTFLKADTFEGKGGGTFSKLNVLLQEKGITTLTLKDGDTLPFGEATLYFYQWENPKAAVNDRSMIMRAEYGLRSALLSADVENRGQKALAEAYGRALSSDILKMPHHGIASYMLEFHEAIRPQLATFSNVRSKIKRVIKQVEKQGVNQWLLTPGGTVVTVTDGETWKVWQNPYKK